MTSTAIAGLRLRVALSLTDFQLEIDTEIAGRGVTALFGRSGCGKSSLLRVIAGLEHKAQGQIYFGEHCWLDGQQRCLAEQRRIGLVSQHDTLLPHLSVLQNLLFGYQRAAPHLRQLQPDPVYQQLDLTPLLERKVSQLSGGQKQRVALGRALLSQPQLLLLDEPFSALDRQGRQEILPYLQQLLRDINIPVVLVSHQLEDVVQLADHLLLLDQGRIQAHGPLAALLHSQAALQHEALSLLFASQTTAGCGSAAAVCCIQLAQQQFLLPAPLPYPGAPARRQQPDGGDPVPCRLRVRARDVSVSLQPLVQSSIQIQLPVRLSHCCATAHPAEHLLTLTLPDGQQLLAQISQPALTRLALTPGMALWANIKAAALH